MGKIMERNGKKDGMGNVFDVTTDNNNRHTYKEVIASGQNEADRVCNIYDLEANCREYVAESSKIGFGWPYITRGDDYNTAINNWPASYRYGSGFSYGFSRTSFRFVLYVM